MSIKIPQVNSQDKEFLRYQIQLSKSLQPVLSNPMNLGVLLSKVELASGDNVVPHKLGRVLQGYLITRQRAAATIYDKQDTNANPADSLSLNASAAVTVDLWVF